VIFDTTTIHSVILVIYILKIPVTPAEGGDEIGLPASGDVQDNNGHLHQAWVEI
jgi:hypothetical protein